MCHERIGEKKGDLLDIEGKISWMGYFDPVPGIVGVY